MTRKDYKLIAAALKAVRERLERMGCSVHILQTVTVTAEGIAAVLQADNPKFNPEKFAAACGMGDDYDA